ncbi:hypothetical protein FRB95_007014 [Tulasnella sp. JGI-2019a]|nr:hypothetical protein FRB95_007014 [Tulasnella sp. JGI-2019a]
MGSINSTLSSEQVMAATAVAAIVTVSALYNKPTAPNATGGEGGDSDATAAAKKPRRKKGKATSSTTKVEDDGSATPPLLAAPAALFDDSKDQVISTAEDTATKLSNSLQVPLAASKSSKKKRKAKSATSTSTPAKSSDDEEKTPEPQTRPQQGGMASSSSSSKAGKKTAVNKTLMAESFITTPSMDASWTRVDPRRSAATLGKSGSEAEASSDAGVTTSGAGDESSIRSATGGEDERLTLAEKLVAKPVKTEVDDMLPADPGLARVMCIGGQPVPETPGGISWRDYEDADELQHSTDADGDDEGWGIVQGKKPRTPIPEAQAPSASGTSRIPGLPSTISDAEIVKRQRQREAKREATKAVKADGEAERLAILAKYKREQEKARMDAQAKKGKSSKLSGGMTASVQNGNLVWE